MSDPSNLPSQSEPGRSVVLALPARSQFPMILRRRNRIKIRGLPGTVQANESEVINIPDEESVMDVDPISNVYSENNCARGRDRSRNHGRGRNRNHNSDRGRGCDRDNHQGDPNRNNNVNGRLTQRYSILGGQENPPILIQPASTNNMVNIEVINIESDNEIDEAVAAAKADEEDDIFADLELEDLPSWKKFNQTYGEWPQW